MRIYEKSLTTITTTTTIMTSFKAPPIAQAYSFQSHAIIKVPAIQSSDKKSTGITTVHIATDSSGSMSGVFPEVAKEFNTIVKNIDSNPDMIPGEMLTFDDTLHHLKYPYCLSSNIRDHGGSLTNMIKPIEYIGNKIKGSKEENHIVIFITDGGDTCVTNFKDVLNHLVTNLKHDKRVTFLTIGIGNGFPVDVAMSIRQNWNTGKDVPPVFWAKERQHIKREFDLASNNLEHLQKVPLDPKIAAVLAPSPLFTHISETYAGQWITVVTSNLDRLPFKFQQQVPSSNQILEIFEQWLVQLQNEALNKNPKLQEMATQVLDQVDSLWEWYKAETKNKDHSDHLTIKLLPDGKPIKDAKPITLSDRLRERQNNKALKTEDNMFAQMRNKMKDFADGKKLEFNNRLEMASALMGARTDQKYAVKAMELCGLTAHEIEQVKQKFITEFPDLLKSSKESVKNYLKDTKASQELEEDDRSVITLSSNLSQLQEPDMLDNLKSMNILDIVQFYGLVGQFVNLRVLDAAQINPWLLSIKNHATHHRIMDSSSINDLRESLGRSGAEEVSLSIGNGEEESGNAVVPIFNEYQATVLAPFICHPFYQMVIASSATGLPGIQNFDAHSALLCARAMKILEEPVSDFNTNLMKDITATMKILYGGRPKMRAFIEALKDDPTSAMIMDPPVPEADDKKPRIKCQAINKPMFFLWVYQDEFTTEQKLAVIKACLQEYIGRMMQDNSPNIEDWFTIDEENSNLPEFSAPENYQQLLNGEDGWTILKECYLPSQVSKKIEAAVREYNFFGAKAGEEVNIILNSNVSKLLTTYTNMKTGPISFNQCYELAKRLLPEDDFNAFKHNADNELVLQIMYHSCCHTSSLDRCTKPLISWDDATTDIKKKLLGKNSNKRVNELSETMIKTADADWIAQYNLIHCQPDAIIRSISMEDVTKIAQESNTEEADYDYNPDTGLCRNACHAKECPYYMVPSINFQNHLDSMRTNRAEMFVTGLHKGIRMWSRSVDHSKMYSDDKLKSLKTFLKTQSSVYLKAGLKANPEAVDNQDTEFLLDAIEYINYKL